MTMRKAIIALILCFPLCSIAQNGWERPDNQPVRQEQKTSPEVYQYEKYLGNVVPEVNGEVVWEKTFTSDKNAQDNYQTMLNFLTAMTKEEGQLEQSAVTLVNKQEHMIVCHFEEWMVFKSTFISTDRTRFIYTLIADCKDNSVNVKIMRIHYLYDELRNGGIRYKAEEWITDKWGLNKKKTRLAKVSGKFRRKTVDRVDDIFNNVQVCLQAK